ncbi:hypothetical protein GCM10027275_28050 [Rhabdobacter roseus]|nr:DUF4153 domain-containing protein [Rhabdobacter roseus]
MIFRRFPWVIVVALGKVSVLIMLAETSRQDTAEHPFLTRLALVFFLALPLTLSAQLVAERRQWQVPLRLAALGTLAGLLLLFFFTLSEVPIQRDYYRFGLFMAGAHLLVSFAPFVGYDEPNGFWQFNKALLLQSLTATLYAGTLYLGLLVAVETIRFLFDVNYPFAIELDLFILIFNFFHTLVFLSGLPPRLDTLEQQTGHNKGLKVFTQYVLLPLEVVYLLILYVYSGKILVNWQLPQGGVAYLVLAFSVAGILALLLIYPLRDAPGERWIRLFSRRFHLALLPLIVLFFVGIFRRIHDYGITENRYLVATLAFWLLGITLYFLISQRDDIRWIPLTLCIISVGIAVGPWSVFSVSRRNQAQRFETLLSKHQLLNDQQKLTGSAKVPSQDYEQLLSIVRYFGKRGESEILRPYFDQLPTGDRAITSAMEQKLVRAMKVQTLPSALSQNFHFSSALERDELYTLDIKDFTSLWRFRWYNEQRLERDNWSVTTTEKGRRINVFDGNKLVVSWDLAARLSELQKTYGSTSYQVEPTALYFDHRQPPYALRLVLQSASKNGDIYTGEGFFLSKR